MSGLRRGICTTIATIGMLAAGAASASASPVTLYVNGSTGNDANACTEATAPCKTIHAAVVKSESLEGVPQIDVSAGTYKEDLDLEKPADAGVTMNGAGSGAGGTEIVGVTGGATAKISLFNGGATLSNLSLLTPNGDAEPGIALVGTLTLDNVMVTMNDETGEKAGIEAREFGSVTMNGGGVLMGTGTEGAAILARFAPLTINGADIRVENGSKSGGIESEGAPLSISNSTVSLGTSATKDAIISGLGAITLDNLSVVQEGAGTGAGAIELALPQAASLNGVKVAMTDAADTAPALVQELGSATYEHVEVGGAWLGPALVTEGGSLTFDDSRLTESPAGTSPAIVYLGVGEVPGLLIQRSVVQASPTATPGALESIEGNVTLDSSELLGGKDGLLFVQSGGKERTLTVAASTIDAGNLGEANEAGVSGVTVIADEDNSIANASIVGSIVLEQQTAAIAPGGKSATINCSYSDIPSQTQEASTTEGAIACAAGSNGNTSSTPESLFATPLTDYVLSPSSSALDSVPVGAIKLPFGLTPSTTDLAGNPRSEELACIALQDKGALELQGHSTPCPVPAPPAPAAKPLAGVISALSISPGAFFAAPSGATISPVAAKARKYGAKISYRDSQVATTTFTVLRKSSGRMQGKSCKKPSKKNKHGKRCTLLTKLGTFTHTDVAGANSLHFSGRIKRSKLPTGSYELQAVAHDAAGNGATVSKSFTIK